MSTVVEGFLDPQGARRALRRIRLRHALLESQTLVSTLLHRLDQSGQALRDWKAAFGEGGSALAGGDVEHSIGSSGIGHVESKDVSEQELLQGADLILQFLNALFEGLGHGLFSAVGTSPEARPSGTAPESKKGGGK